MTSSNNPLASTPLASREWRIANLYTILDSDGHLRPFDPNHAQRAYYNRLWFCNHILKARKLGFSTFNVLLFLDDLLFARLTAGVIDYTIDDAELKLAMAALAYDNLDNPDVHPVTHAVGAAIKAAVPMTSRAKRSLEFANGSVFRAGTSLRGQTPQRLLISELGKTAIWAPRKATEIVNGAFNAITPGSVRQIESTHEGGKLGIHYRLLQDCMRLDAENLSPIQSRFHFFAWWLDPRYTDSTPIAIRPEILAYAATLERDHGIRLTTDQVRWYDLKHREQGHGMKKEFPSSPGEAFEAIVEGAIYGTEMANLRAAGRIRDFSPEAGHPLYTFWDIGLSDFSAVWLIQPLARDILVVDWFEAEGMTAAAMADHLVRWERKYRRAMARHFLPHDAETRDRASGLSYVQVLTQAGVHPITVVPRTPDVWLGIGYARDLLPHCWFHKTHCDTSRAIDGSPYDPASSSEEFPSGVACLEGYSRDTSPTSVTLREMPRHDQFSHSADAFRTFAEARRRGLIHPETARKPQARR